MIANAIIALMRESESIEALVGSRIYQLIRPTKVARPAITVQQFSADRPTTLEGATDGVVARLQINIIGDSLPVVQQIAAAVRSCIHGYRCSISGIEIGFCAIIGEGDIPVLLEQGEESGIETRRLDVEVIYKES